MRKYFLKIAEILRSFDKYLGKKMYIALAFSAIASVIDGLGITLLIPLLTVMFGGDLDQGSVYEIYISDLLSWLNFPTGSVLGVLALLSFAFLLKGAILFAALYRINQLKADLLRLLKREILSRMNELSYQSYISQGSGYFVNLLNEQTNRSLLAFHALSHLMMHALNVVVYLVLAFSIAWRFGLSALVLGIVVVQFFRIVNDWVQANSIRISVKNKVINQAALNFIHGFKYLSATAQTKLFLSKIHQDIEQLRGLERVQGIMAAVTLSIREPLVILTLSIILLFQVEVMGQEMTPMLVSIVLFYRSMNSILQMQGYLQNTLETYGSMYQVQTFLDQNQLVRRGSKGSSAVEASSGEIQFDNVSVVYSNSEKPALQDVSVTLQVNKCYCVIGTSGSGKTTLIDTLLGLVHPSQGQMKLSGVQYDDLDLQTLRQSVGYVSQESILFEGTICENVTGRTSDQIDDTTRDELIECLRKAGLRDIESTFSAGIDTRLGERGAALSGGQRQRIFLARELFRKPKILILDEATSALDNATESIVNLSLKKLKGELTIILITHRMSSVSVADEILVMNEGCLFLKCDYETLKQNDSTLVKRLWVEK